MKPFEGWTPIRVYWQLGTPMVDWAYLGRVLFTEPFFDQPRFGLVQHVGPVALAAQQVVHLHAARAQAFH